METVLRTKTARSAILASLLCAALVAISACSSASSSTSAGGDAPSSTSAGGDASVVQAAKATLSQYEATPTAIGITVPLKAPPPKGKAIIYLQGDFSQFQPTANGIKAAAAAVGWNYRSIPFQMANPATLVSGLNQALQYHPSYVVVGGLPEVLWASAIPAYEKAGVKIIVGTSPDTTYTNTFIGNYYGPAPNERAGDIIGDYMIAQTNGHASALLVGIAGTVGNEYNQAVQATLAKCAGCKSQIENMTAAQFTSNEVIPAVISTLQRNPGINYVAAITGAYLVGLPAALSAAKLAGKVKIVGNAPTAQNLEDLKAGTEAAYTTTNLTYCGWQAVDMALRNAEGMPIQDQQGANSPTQLLLPSSTFAITADYPEPQNFPEQFMKLWHVG
jgi:ribose transport system substrate-binding protein